MPYRFKTKAEFISEFGTDFYHNVVGQWNSSGGMDHLFGFCPTNDADQASLAQLLFTEAKSITLIAGPPGKDNSWLISKDMITEVVSGAYVPTLSANERRRSVTSKINSASEAALNPRPYGKKLIKILFD